MNKSLTWLLDFKSNTYSQTGEDGIIKKILEVMPQNDKWCVDFGAWDGLYLSNTRNLIEAKDYSAILIEANKEKFAELQKNYAQNKNVITINRFVGFENENNLDQILKMTPIPNDFDFLSIDIDGNDYHVWKAMSYYNPKIVCIEFNPTIPTEIEFIQSADNSVKQGASLLSLVKLGKDKGYELVSVLKFNAFFVRSKFYPLFKIENNSPKVLRTDSSDITYLFSGYDGKIFLTGSLRLPWHGGIELRESKVQHLPRILQKHPNEYRNFEKIIWKLYRLFSKLHTLIRKQDRHLRKS
ncbi:MAG: hypothetical protein PVJ06_13760 [Desulfobacterales bacterium]|jgi:hypothetical protein